MRKKEKEQIENVTITAVETYRERRNFMGERIVVRTVNNIKVTSHIPDNVSESVKRNKINQIYDILIPDSNDAIDPNDKDKTDKSA